MPEATSTLIPALLNSELIRWFANEIVQLWKERQFHATYRVLSLDATIEIMDKHGRNAVYTKYQRLEFLQNGVFAVLDQAFGDGEIFAKYQCSPGVAVDKYREGARWKILIALHGTRNRGDQEDLFIERNIRDGFLGLSEYWETFIDHPTQELTITAVFPKSRLPKKIVVIEEQSKRSHTLSDQHMTSLPHGKVEYQWHRTKPRLFDGYILQWQW